MRTPFTSQIHLQRMSVPSWLAFIAAVWWAALLTPSQSQQRFTAGLLDGMDLPGAVSTPDRYPSLQTNDRRSESARDGNPPAAVAAAATIQPFVDPVSRIVTFTRPPAARPARSPAQPRAPPANVGAHAD